MTVFKDEKIWRAITNIWSVVFMIFLIIDFVSKNSFEFLIIPLSIVYMGVLGLYVSTKEFDRWYEFHDGRHPGEIFVGVWTILIFVFIIISAFSQGSYKVSSEVVADYIMVLSVFALTQKSKSLHKRKIMPKRKSVVE